jgi:endonuclease YncB( thermonuclease family)
MKKILTLVFFIIFHQAVFAISPFPDVPETHTNYEAIYFLKSRGVINGYDNGNFGADDPITRVQALKILLLGSEIKPNKNLVSNFPDVPSTHWGQRFIAEAKNRNIVNGKADGTFCADTTLNLAEGLKMLLKTNDINPKIPINPPFADVSTSDWFSPFAAYARKKRLVDIVEYLEPAKKLTRGELAELMYRLAYINENELNNFQVTNKRQVTIIKVYDGDTFTTSTNEKIRLIGVDTPEKGENYDPEATTFVKSLILDKKATIKVCKEKIDRYGRTLAEVWTTDNKSVAEELIKSGLAKVYIPSSCGEELRASYKDIELDAITAGAGIWSTNTQIEEASAPLIKDYKCGTKAYCYEMGSCEEAQYFLNTCGLDRLDSDNDGIPCENLCTN